MALWTPPPPPTNADDVTNAVETVVNDAVDEAGDVVDAVTDAMQGGGSSGGTPPAPDPEEPIVELFTAVQTFADNAVQIVDQISTSAEDAIGTVANGVEGTLSRLIPIVIGFLGDFLDLGGVATKISSLIDRLASKVDQVIRVVADRNGGKTDGGAPPRTDTGSGLRELARAVTRDAAWRKKYLKRAAYQLAVKPRPAIAKGGLGGGLSDAASKASNGDTAAAQRMLARLATLDEKLRRLEVRLVNRGPKSAAERAAFTRCRLSLGTVVQRGGVQLASSAAPARASIAPGLIKAKL